MTKSFKVEEEPCIKEPFANLSQIHPSVKKYYISSIKFPVLKVQSSVSYPSFGYVATSLKMLG